MNVIFNVHIISLFWQQLLSSVLVTLPREASGDKSKSSIQIVLDLAGDILSKLPSSFDLEEVNI